MKKNKNDLFDVLNWVLKNNNKEPSQKNVSCFMLNRWLSMSSIDNANIVNSTFNRWLLKKINLPYVNFFRCILPTTKKQIQYIKKQNNLDTMDDITHISNNMELSTREIIFLEKSLADLNAGCN